MDLQIEKVQHDQTVIPGGLTWVFVGQPKTRKTSEASRWSEKGQDGVLILDADLGADMVDGVHRIPITSLNEPMRPITKDGKIVVKDGEEQWEVIPPDERGYFHRTGPKRGEPMNVYSLQKVWAWMKEHWDESGYDTLVVDTLDEVNEWIESVVKSDLDVESIGDASYGTGWARARERNLDIVKRLQNFLKNRGHSLILIVHAKESRMEDDKVQLRPDLPRGLGSAVTAKADVIGYTTFDRKTGDCVISFEAYDERMIGSRLRPLAQKTLEFNYETIKETVENYEA